MPRAMSFVLLATLVLMAVVSSEARYLPTRADDSRLEDIRELLREILERTSDSSSSSSNSRSSGLYGYDKRFIVKRSVGGDAAAASAASAASAGASAPVVSGMGERMVPLFNLAQ